MDTSPQETTGWDLAQRLEQHWRLALAVFAGVFLLTALVIGLLPNRYSSTMKLVVKNDRVDPQVGTDKQTQGIVYVNEVSEARINTEIQLLTSNTVLRAVVQQCHLSELAGKPGQPAARREELALRRLQQDLNVAPVRNANVIEISYASRDPERSAAVLNALWAAYTNTSRQAHGVPGMVDFFKRLTTQYDEQLAQAQAALNDFRKLHHVVALPEEQTLLLGNAAHLQAELADSAATASRGAASAERLQRAMNSLPPSVERNRRSMPNQILSQQMASLLITLENKRTEAALRYPAGDRTIRELDAEIARTQAALSQSGSSSAEEVSVAANPALDAARDEYLRAAAESAGASAQSGELTRQLAEVRGKLASLATEAARYQQLTDQVADLTQLSATYRHKAEEARFEQSLDEERISNLAVVDAPVVAAMPSSPRRGLLLALAVFWAALVAFFAVLVAELTASPVRAVPQLSEPEMPLLSQTPYLAQRPGAGLRAERPTA